MAGHDGGIKTYRLTAPVQPDDLAGLELGGVVYLDGLIYTGREGVYRRLLDQGETPPVDLAGISNVNFHCSPAAAIDDDGTFRVGAVTATASFRFAKWLPQWFRQTGCRVIIGKGGMSERDYREIFVPAGAVYLTTVGYGTGALLGRGIQAVEGVHWLDELGIAQAIWVLRVKEFGPLLVESDLAGNSLFERHNRRIDSHIESLYDGLKPPALRRFGETDDKTDELI
ncbi:MAG: fumarate hydratase C-terminal domain-containing protein [Alphaproteobacteria bacterium]|jgi:L(+)-tartrate dehydratase beta subunit|nr:fumarate hydratase C-terminal domain-containing protein [Alphaproteobacteria bacterium]MDP6563237.1 fumarate hydratase C-terminal domain-containing protein [Alphaproteobacteria bacterium]MDP6814885.1 fumarate hydratase C-terminal domain-containing protein [Alphaproteobacteria bacterium]